MSRLQDVRARAEHVVERLDERLFDQARLPGADHPLAVAIVSRFQDWAGHFERRELPHADELGAEHVGRSLRTLRWFVSDHLDFVGSRATEVCPQCGKASAMHGPRGCIDFLANEVRP